MTNDSNDAKLWTYHQVSNADSLLEGHERQETLFKEINKKLHKGKILEIGFGDGYLLNRLKSKFSCFGSDISEENVKRVSQKYDGITLQSIGVDGVLPYDDNFFDGFVASEVLEHMSDTELSVCVKEVSRILKPGGYAFITFPSNEKLADSNCFCPNCNHTFHRWGHKQSFNDEKVEALFSDFDIVHKREFYKPYTSGTRITYIISRFICRVRTIANYIIDIPDKTYIIVLRNL